MSRNLSLSLPIVPPISWKQQIKSHLERTIYWTGLSWAYVKVTNIRGAIVFMYHSVAPPELATWIDPNLRITPQVFETQMKFLANHRRVISLSQLLNELENNQIPPAGTVVLTFDDGYLDNMTTAAPILARYGIPATWFLCTGVIERGENLWIDEMYTAFRTRTQHQLTLKGIQTWDLRDSKQIFAAYMTHSQHLILASLTERKRILSEMIEQLQPTAKPPRLMLSWDEVRKVVQEFPEIEMGVHSRNHIDLSSHNRDVIYEEIEHCIADFYRELGHKPAHFAFPYNRHTQEARTIIRELGFRSSMGNGSEPLIGSDTDYFAIPRIESLYSSTLFRFYTSGTYPHLPNGLLRRASLDKLEKIAFFKLLKNNQ